MTAVKLKNEQELQIPELTLDKDFVSCIIGDLPLEQTQEINCENIKCINCIFSFKFLLNLKEKLP